MNDVRRGAQVLHAVTCLAAGVLLAVLSPLVYGAGDIAFEIAGSDGAWVLSEVVTVVPGAHHLTVVSETPWELVLTSRMLGAGADATMPMRSAVYLGFSHRQGESRGETEWIPVSPRASTLSRRGGPTGPDGDAVSIDLRIYPSWDDPPGVPFVTEMTATLVAGDTALSAYAHPVRLSPGGNGPIAFWFRVPVSGPPLRPGDAVRLDVWKGDVEVVARRYSTVGEGAWQPIIWDDLPEGGLEEGAYRFRILDEGDRLLGSGVFYVEGEVGESASAGTLAYNGGQNTATGREEGRAKPYPELPDVKIAVTGDPVPPGEPAVWSITLINPEDLSLTELQAEVCLTAGWSFLAADAPSFEAGGSVAQGKTCRNYLLGTLLGHRERKVRLTLLYWDDDPAQRVARRSEMSIQLTAALEPGGARVLIAEARAPLIPADDPLLRPSIDLHGRVYVDVNGTGTYEADEPVVPGAKIVVDGRAIATTNRRGEYRATLTEVPHLIWAQSDRGSSVPQTFVYEEIWTEHGRLDIPISPSARTALESQGSADGTAGYFVLLTQLDAGAKRSEAGARIRTGAFGARGGLEMEVKGGAGWDLGGRRSEWLVDDLRLSGFAEDDGVNLQFALESGLERKIKMGLLRPTKPTLAAYRLRVDIDPHSGRGDPRGSRPHYGATQRPDVSTAGEWRLGGEWGYAAGDVWSCWVNEKTAAYVTQGGRISSSVTRSTHERVEKSGPKRGEAGQFKVEFDGAATWSGRRWPYHVEVIAGTPRTISPSCGLSPFDGWKWRAIAAVPVGAVPAGAGIQGVEWSGMTWPMAVDREGGTPAGGSAYELGLSFRPIYLREERVDLSTAVQWERRDVGQMGPPRLAARLRSRIGGLHDLRLELGALALASTDNPDRLARGDRRLALSWRMTRGQVRPWLSYELYSQNGAIERSQEAGLQLSRSWNLQGTAAVLNTTLRMSRAVDADDVKDKLRVDIRSGPSAGRFEWSGTTPVAGGGSPGLAVLEAYEKRSWKLLFEGKAAGGAGEWSLSLDGATSPDDAELAGLATVGGHWTSGRWQAGLGRGVTHKDAEVSEFVTAVFRVSGKRGPWGVQAEALRKAGVHDTALHHAAYHITLRRHLSDDWAALAGLSWSLTLGEQGVWRYRTGIERRLVGGEAALRTNTETNAGANPDARPGSESDANAVTQPPAVALVIGLVWEASDESSPWRKGPRIEASLALPYLW